MAAPAIHPVKPYHTHPSLSPQTATACAMLSSSMFMWYESRCTATLAAPTSETNSIACSAGSAHGLSAVCKNRISACHEHAAADQTHL